MLGADGDADMHARAHAHTHTHTHTHTHIALTKVSKSKRRGMILAWHVRCHFTHASKAHCCYRYSRDG